MDFSQGARVARVLVPRLVGKSSGRRLGEDRRQVGIAIDARLHLRTRSSGTLPSILCDVVDGELEMWHGRFVLLRLGTHRPRISVVVVNRHLTCLGDAKELGPLAVGSLPIDGQTSGSSNTGNVLVESTCRLAVWVGEDGRNSWADGAVGASG